MPELNMRAALTLKMATLTSAQNHALKTSQRIKMDEGIIATVVHTMNHPNRHVLGTNRNTTRLGPVFCGKCGKNGCLHLQGFGEGYEELWLDEVIDTLTRTRQDKPAIQIQTVRDPSNPVPRPIIQLQRQDGISLTLSVSETTTD